MGEGRAALGPYLLLLGLWCVKTPDRSMRHHRGCLSYRDSQPLLSASPNTHTPCLPN